MPDPEGSRDEVLSISKRHDPRLYSEIGGATWNFPASKRGRVTVTLKLVEQTARLILTDRWYNTCDAYAASQSPFVFELSTEQLGRGYVELMLDYDTERGCALASVDGKCIASAQAATEVPTGISYLVMQCATEGESEGFYVKSLAKKDLP